MKLIAGDGALWHGGLNLGPKRQGVNAPPVAGADVAAVTTGAAVSIQVLQNDVDPEGGPLAVVAARVASGGGSVTVETDGALTYSAPAGAGTAVLAYTVRDAAGLEAEGTVTVEIRTAAGPPWIAGDVVLIGASLLERANRDAATDPQEAKRWAHVGDVFAQVGFTGRLHNRARGGHRFGDTIAALPGIVADYPAETALYVVHRSGNDVTDTRPWDGSQQAAFDAGLAAIRDAIPAAADQVNVTVTRRLYNTAPTALYTEPDVNGSKRFNDNAVVPFIQANQPGWLEDGMPVLDGYDWSDRLSPHLADTTHFQPHAEHLFVEWMLWRIARTKRLFAPPQAADVAGRSLILSLSTDAGFNAATGVNHVPAANYGLRLADGTRIPGLAVQQDFWGEVSPTSTPDVPGAYARIADPRFHTAEMMAIYCYGKNAPDLKNARETGTLRIMGLPPGATGRALFAASRATTSTRAVDISHGGATVTLRASTNVSSNMESLAFAADAGGEAAFALDVTAGASHGYVNAVILDFD